MKGREERLLGGDCRAGRRVWYEVSVGHGGVVAER